MHTIALSEHEVAIKDDVVVPVTPLSTNHIAWSLQNDMVAQGGAKG